MRAPTPGEFELADLSVAVVFRGRVGKGVRRAFVDAVAAWGRAAVERGAFHDGPIRLASPGVTFVGTRAQFRIDASRSGQDTLNWLSLVMLDFGYEAHPISSVNFAHSDAELDAMFGPPSAAPILVPFPATPLASELPAEGEAAGMYVPLGARPHGSLHSKSFRVLELPVNEWDSFVSTVYFARNPRSEERRRFVALVRAWLHLGIFGGLGGGRTHWAEDVKFDEATDSAIIEADMGQADPDIAQRILIWALEGFETQDGAPIDALVFGTLEQ